MEATGDEVVHSQGTDHRREPTVVHLVVRVVVAVVVAVVVVVGVVEAVVENGERVPVVAEPDHDEALAGPEPHDEPGVGDEVAGRGALEQRSHEATVACGPDGPLGLETGLWTV